MRDDEFHVTVAALDHSTALVSVRGDVDIATSPTLRRLLAEIEACGHREVADGHIVIDLSRVTLLDASGINVLMEAARTAGRHVHTLVLRDPSPNCMRVLEITRLVSAFRIVAAAPFERILQPMSA
jgi:anti-anti-sigma factor